ncbi:MAG: hypothetical protein IKX91_04980 [Firmicutes bacterium]|nr:hypothetical protein [Bacillota bacterium]
MPKKHSLRRALALVLAILLFVLTVPVYAFAATSAFAKADAACYDAIKNRRSSVDVKGMGLTTDNVDAFLDEFRENHPDVTYYGSPSFYTYSGSSVTGFDLFYDSNVSTADIATYEATVSSILAGVSGSWTDVQKVLYFHDWLATNCEYDMRLYDNTMPNESYNALGAIVRRTAVCNGYALAMCDLCNRAGIECKLIDSASMNHAWNVVKVGGSWYHLDVTWDDPTADVIGNVKHTFFLLSDSAMKTTYSGSSNVHSGWKSSVACTNTKYDSGAYWTNAVSKIELDKDGNAYYVRNDGTASVKKGNATYNSVPVMTFVSRDAKTGAEKVLKSVTDFWPSWNSGSYWTAPYMKLAKVGEFYYFNGPATIYACYPVTGEVTAFNVDTSNGYVYGLAERNGKLVCSLSTTPQESGTVYNVPVEKFLPTIPSVDPEPVVDPTPTPTPQTDGEPIYAEPTENKVSKKEAVTVTMSPFKTTLNGRVWDNEYASYPLIFYKDITYFPLTWYECRFLGLTTDYDYDTKTLAIDLSSERGQYRPTLQSNKNKNSYGTAKIVTDPVIINGIRIDNTKEQYPFLNFRGITYFPCIWHYCVDVFHWNYDFTFEKGLVISVKN